MYWNPSYGLELFVRSTADRPVGPKNPEKKLLDAPHSIRNEDKPKDLQLEDILLTAETTRLSMIGFRTT